MRCAGGKEQETQTRAGPGDPTEGLEGLGNPGVQTGWKTPGGKRDCGRRGTHLCHLRLGGWPPVLGLWFPWTLRTGRRRPRVRAR